MNRTRGGLTPQQVRAYAPEHHPRLAMVLARPHDPTRQDGTWPWRDDDGTALLPMHPHQADRLAAHIDIIGTRSAAPLMSLRTLAPAATRRHHVKTAVDLQMTSAIRRVSPAALHNGPHLSRITAALTPRTGMAVHVETATMTVLDSTGQPRPDLSAILRTLPHTDAIPIPLAALAEPDPATGTPLIATVIATTTLTPPQWWNRCVPLLLTGPLTLAGLGISLEAHGQNTLIELDHGHPHRLVYRDFGGVRVDPDRLAANGIHCPPLHGDIPQPHPHTRHTTLLAALYATVLRQLVHTLTHHYQTPADDWWRPVAEHSHRLSHTDPHLHDMIFADTWPLKATTAMRLSPDPLTNQWIRLPNPIAGHR
ncbi:IucA/IucC family protein [Stackebrandtia endophytica]|uniref:IucA/IucC family protein n=1 Tax=Stackebrandtia endophytica TaxID=1496996 RepID=UPI00363B5420